MMERTTRQTIEWEKVDEYTVNAHGASALFRAYAGVPDDRLRCIVSRNPGSGWHVSVSHTDRYPTWDEVADARYRFTPNRVTLAMLLPPREEFVNVHDTTLHLHEVPGDTPIE